jgi:hypothetical protein
MVVSGCDHGKRVQKTQAFCGHFEASTRRSPIDKGLTPSYFSDDLRPCSRRAFCLRVRAEKCHDFQPFGGSARLRSMGAVATQILYAMDGYADSSFGA